MEAKIKKLIIGFFILMAALTLLSRVAASAMVAKVQTANKKSGNLSFEIDGTGIVSDNAKKYIKLPSGYVIDDIAVSAGQPVDKGDLILVYNMEQLMEQKKTLQKELTELQISYNKAKLGEDDGISVSEAARQKSEAEEDLKLAGDSLDDQKRAVREQKQKDYNEAEANYEDTKQAREDALTSANRAIEDANADLTKLTKKVPEIDDKLQAYKTAVTGTDTTAITRTRNDIYDFYYDDKYSEHQKAVADAKEKLTRAQEDLKDIQHKWELQINNLLFSSADQLIENNYQTMVASRDAEVKSATRTVADLQEAYDDLTAKDKALDQAIDNFCNAIRTGVPGQAYSALYDILYDNLNLDDTQISSAKTKVDRAKKDAKRAEAEWNKKVEAAFEKADELHSDLLEMKAGSYDYKEDIKESETQLRNAKRGLETADFGLNKAQDDYEKNKQLTQQDISSIDMNIEDKEEEIKQVKDLIKNEGRLTSPVAGIIVSADVEEGATLTGQEKLIIGTGGYELRIKADKNDMKNFEKGDEVDIKLDEGAQLITSEIENIGTPDQDGNVNLTALLPEGDYQPGAALEFEIKADSKDYTTCIPIQALRQDDKGVFILLAKESNSVLGKVYTAFRMDVKVLSKDAKTAAVDASLSGDDLIIIGSNKNISEGDRVRVVDAE